MITQLNDLHNWGLMMCKKIRQFLNAGFQFIKKSCDFHQHFVQTSKVNTLIKLVKKMLII